MSECFAAHRATQISLAGTPQEVQGFFQEPQRVIGALLQPEQVEQLDRRRFSVRMHPLGGLGLQVQPHVTLQISPTPTGGSDLEILDCEIKDNDWLNRHFHLEFAGDLDLEEVKREAGSQNPWVTLGGEAHLQVCIDIPPLLRLTPRPVLNSVGTMVLDGVLRMIQRSLRQKLPQSFRTYQQSQPDLVRSSV